MVLTTRLVVPPIPPGMVERPRLTEKLARAVERPLTLIVAPAGSGKTALLSGWAAGRRARAPVAWLALGPEANSRRLFWTAVVAALQRADDAPRRARRRRAAATSTPSCPPSWRGSKPCPEPVVLVLDDFHEVDDPEVMRDLDTLLDHAPDRLRLVVATRSDPSLRLQRLRIAGRLEEIRNADLAFTVAETEQLLGRARPAGSATTICGCSGTGPRAGWPASGWPRCRCAATRTRAPSSSGFAGDDRAVSDYLMAEVVSRQSPDMLDFLLRTAIVEQVSGSLADALTGSSGGQRRLEELVQRRRPGHPARRPRALVRVPPAAPGAVARRADASHATGVGPSSTRGPGAGTASGTTCSRALRHAMLGEDWELAADVLGRHWLSLLARGEGAALLEVVDRIPAAGRGPARRARAGAGRESSSTPARMRARTRS